MRVVEPNSEVTKISFSLRSTKHISQTDDQYISAGYSKKLAFNLKSHRDHNTLYLWNCQYIYYFKPALAKSVASRPPPTASITILDQTKTALSQVSALNIKYPK